MNPEYLQALWTLGVTIACCLSVASELVSPKPEAMPPEELDAAIVIYDEFARLNPNSANAYLLRGGVLLNQQEFQKALVDFQEAVRLDPESAEAFFGRAQAYQNLGDVEAALADCNQAIRLKPDSSMAYVGRGQMLLIKAEWATIRPRHDAEIDSLETPCDAQWPVNVTLADYWQRVSDQAGADFETAIRLDPQNAQAFQYRGFHRHKQGQLKDALADFDEAIRLDAQRSLTYHFRARLWSSLHKFTMAVADYDRAIELNPNASDALYERATVLGNQGRREEALADTDRALGLNPSDTKLYKLRAMLKIQNGEFGAAILDFSEVLKLTPRDTEACMNRSITRVLKGDLARGLLDALVVDDLNPKLLKENVLEEIAVRVLRDADEKLAQMTDENDQDQQFAVPLRDRGLAYGMLGLSDKSLHALDAAIRLDPSSSLAYSLRGRVHLSKRQWDQAIEDFDAAIGLNPTDASLYADRGLARSENEQWTAACDDFDIAIKLDPDQYRAIAHRGAARQSLGEMDLAIADYDHVIGAGPFYKRSERNWMHPPANNEAGQNPANDKSKTSGAVAAKNEDESVFLNSKDAVTASSPIAFLESAIKPANPAQQTPKSGANQPAQAAGASAQSKDLIQKQYQLRVDPDFTMAYRNRAACREARNEWSKALADYEELTRLTPKDFKSYRQVAWLKATCPDESCRNGAEALELALRSLEMALANDVDCLVTVAAAYAEIGDFENAVEFQSRAHEAVIAICQKEFDERRQHFQSVAFDKVLESSDVASATTDTTAVDVALRACEQTSWKDSKLIEALADAYANADQLARAIDCQQKVYNLNRASREAPLLEVLELYRAQKPYRAFGDKVVWRK